MLAPANSLISSPSATTNQGKKKKRKSLEKQHKKTTVKFDILPNSEVTNSNNVGNITTNSRPTASQPKNGSKQRAIEIRSPAPHTKNKGTNLSAPIDMGLELSLQANRNNIKKPKPAKPKPNLLFNPNAKTPYPSKESLAEKYPVLENEPLIKKFMEVTMTNNQKGRIRQVLKELLRGTSDACLADVIHDKIQSILRNSSTLVDTDLRKIRVLYNMLNVAIADKKEVKTVKKSHDGKEVKQIKRKETDAVEGKEIGDEECVNKPDDSQEVKEAKRRKIDARKGKEIDGEECVSKSGNSHSEEVIAKETEGEKEMGNGKEVKKKEVAKVKGPKRYVVFVGNLPTDVKREHIMRHFSELSDDIVDIRMPPAKEGKNSAIAYVELKKENSFEMALSKHHTMLCNRRINVLYTTQKNSKITKAEAKAKASKLVAMVKAGQLYGSIPLKSKRSARRAKQRAAMKAESGPKH